MIKMTENKKKLEEILHICSKCEVVDEVGNFCRDIDISKKIFSGCGKWKKEGEFILNQEFYDEIKKQIALRQVIEDLIKESKQ